MGTITYDLDQRPTSLKIIFIASTTDAALNLEQSNRFFSQFLMPTQNNSAAALLNILPLSGTFELVLLLNIPLQLEQSGQPATHCIISVGTICMNSAVI
jgi:hypothetical protein